MIKCSKLETKMLVKEAPVVWNLLRGILCVYKPAEISCENLRKALITRICDGMFVMVTLKKDIT